MQNSDFRTRITSLYGSQPSSVVFACKTATLGSQLEVSMGRRPHLWIFAFKTVTLAQNLQVSIGPSPPQWFCASQQHHYDQNYQPPWVPDLTCRLVHAKQRD